MLTHTYPSKEEVLHSSIVLTSITGHDRDVVTVYSSSSSSPISFVLSQELSWFPSLPGGKIQTFISEGLEFSTPIFNDAVMEVPRETPEALLVQTSPPAVTVWSNNPLSPS